MFTFRLKVQYAVGKYESDFEINVSFHTSTTEIQADVVEKARRYFRFKIAK